MNRGEFMGGTFEFHADLPQDVFDKILGNTPEEMRRMLTPGNTFELYDREGNKVVYVALPEGSVFCFCKDCRFGRPTIDENDQNFVWCPLYRMWKEEDGFCDQGKREENQK